MPPPDPPEVGEPSPDRTPEDDPGHGIADCYRAIEDEPRLVSQKTPTKGQKALDTPGGPKDDSYPHG